MDFSVKKCFNSEALSELESMLPNSIEMTNENFENSTSKLKNFVNELVWIHILVIILASYSTFKCWRYITNFSYKFMDEIDKRKKLKRVNIFNFKKNIINFLNIFYLLFSE